MLSPELSSAVESSARTAVYVDVGSQGGNEVKPSQTSPGGGSSTIKSSGGREREREREREEKKSPPVRDRLSVRILSPWRWATTD